jgi:hypothetical protein
MIYISYLINFLMLFPRITYSLSHYRIIFTKSYATHITEQKILAE